MKKSILWTLLCSLLFLAPFSLRAQCSAYILPSSDWVSCPGGTGDYYGDYISSNCTYRWTVSGGTILSGQGTDHIIVQWGSNAGWHNMNLEVEDTVNWSLDTDYQAVEVKWPSLDIYFDPAPNLQCNPNALIPVCILSTESCALPYRTHYTGYQITGGTVVRQGIDYSCPQEDTLFIQPTGDPVSLVVQSSWGGSSCTYDTTIIIQPQNIPATAGFTYVTNQYDVQFTHTPTPLDSLRWDFGDGTSSTLANPLHAYATGGNYNVCLITYNYCGADTLCQTVTLACPAITHDFSFSVTGHEVQFTDLSQGTSLNSWQWAFGDGNTSTASSPLHTYSGPGQYQVMLIVSDSCSSDTIVQIVDVTCISPTVTFAHTSNLLTTTFSNTSSGTAPMTYGWDFGDGTTDTTSGSGFAHIYSASGSYVVCLTQSNACGSNTFCDTVEISCPPPVADFSTTISQRTVSFTNTSVSADTLSFAWDMGDGNTSPSLNPQHTYAADGNYEVCLTVSSTCGAETHCDTVTILTTGRKTWTDLQIVVYPNPANRFVNIEGTFPASAHWTLQNTLGQTLQTGQISSGSQREQLNIESLGSCTYLLKIQSGELWFCKKILKP